MYGSSLEILYIYGASFEPYVGPGGAEPRSVDVGGVLGGCEQHPCALGQACTYLNYSLSCAPCDVFTAGLDGKLCTPCQASRGPSADQASCKPCPERTYSAFGACQPCDAPRVVQASSSQCNSCPAGTGPNANHTGCVSCAAGRYSVFGAACQACDAPRVVQASSSQCNSCPAGSGPNASHTGCVSCVGTNYSIVGVCQVCTPPSTVNSDHTACAPPFACTSGSACPAGVDCDAQACDTEGANCDTETANRCERCAPGNVSLGTAPCAPCTDVGKISNAAQSVCVSCVAGQEPDPTRSDCLACAAGRYSAFGAACQACDAPRVVEASSSQCNSCPAGTGPNANHTSCVVCALGLYSPDELTSCQECPGDAEYANERGTACIPCPQGQKASIDGTTCKCNDGFFNTTTAYRCHTAPNQEHVAADRTALHITVGGTRSDLCSPCTELAPCVDASSSLNCVNGVPAIAPGYARAPFGEDEPMDLHFVEVFLCPDISAEAPRWSACQGGGVWDITRCDDGHTGPLCHVCEPRHSRSGARCESCEAAEAASTSSLVGAIVAIAVVVLVVGIRHYYTRAVTQRCDRLWELADADQNGTLDLHEVGALLAEVGGGANHSTIQTAEVFAHLDTDGNGTVDKTEFAAWYNQATTARLQMISACALAIVQPVKIIVGFAQVVGQLGTVLRLELPPGITRLIDSLKPLIANLFDSFLPMGCIATLDYYERWLIQTLAVPIMLLAMVTLLFVRDRRRAVSTTGQTSALQSEMAQCHQRFSSRVSLVVFVLYPNIWCAPLFLVHLQEVINSTNANAILLAHHGVQQQCVRCECAATMQCP
eukprot:SAG11_NODE_2621_length_3168_cov_2.076572_1_plen_827_part_00